MGSQKPAENRRLLDTARAKTGSQYGNFLGDAEQNASTAQQNSSQLRQSIMQQYGGFSQPQGTSNGYQSSTQPQGQVTQGTPGRERVAGDNPVTGTAVPRIPGQVEGPSVGQQAASGSGELNTFMPGGLRPNASGWFDLPERASNTAEEHARAGYQNIAEGGGNVGFDANAMRQRASTIIPSFYDAYKRNAQRRSNIQGGYSPGFDDQMAEIGRQAGREGFNAVRQVEGDIADRSLQMGDINTRNRLQGIGGLSNMAALRQSRDASDLEARLGLGRQYQQGGQFSAAQRQGLYNTDRSDFNTAMQQRLAGLGGLSQNELMNLELRQGQNQPIDWSKWARTGANVVDAFIPG